MLFFPNPSNQLLTIGLKQMPVTLTLMEFKDELRDLFHRIYKDSPDHFEDKNSRNQETLVSRLAIAFECHPSNKRDTPVKDETLNGTIRTIRHMIYNHAPIKENLPSEGKKILIPYRARLQILLAKRLSTLRIIKEQREHVLNQDDVELEDLLSQEDQDIKIRISQGNGQTTGKDRKGQSHSRSPLWQRRGRPVYRMTLTRGVVIEIDDRLYRPADSESNQEALAKYLEAMFNIERGSETSEELITQVTNASSAPLD